MCNSSGQRHELTNQESVSVAQGRELCAGGEVWASSRSCLRNPASRPNTEPRLRQASRGARLGERGLLWQRKWEGSKAPTGCGPS
jgi:hypothetical protein